ENPTQGLHRRWNFCACVPRRAKADVWDGSVSKGEDIFSKEKQTFFWLLDADSRIGGISLMPIRRVGHVVLKVRDLDKARRFYCDFLGMTIGNASERGMFLRFNDYHHDLAIFKTGDDADPPRDNQVGLVHVALVTDGVQTVREFYDRAKAMGVEVTGWTNHA